MRATISTASSTALASAGVGMIAEAFRPAGGALPVARPPESCRPGSITTTASGSTVFDGLTMFGTTSSRRGFIPTPETAERGHGGAD